MTYQVQGRSISLRQTTPDDAPILFRAYQDKNFINLYSSGTPLPDTEEKLRQVLQQRTQCKPADLRCVECLIIHKQHGAVGVASLSNYSRTQRQAEFLIGLFDEKDRNAGYAVEASLLICDLAFNQLGLNQIYVHVYENNQAVLKLLKKSAYQQVRVYKNRHYSEITKEYMTLYKLELTVSRFRQHQGLARRSRKLLGRDITQAPSSETLPSPLSQNAKVPSSQNATTAPPFELMASRHFTAWLAEQGIGLAFTTYQVGKFFLLGLQADGRLSIFERTFNRCMGLCATTDTLYMSTLYQVWRFDNALAPGQNYQGYDRLYVPQLAYTTGSLDIHDMILDKDGRLIFVNTLFGCLATVTEKYSFKPLWKPPFLSQLIAEDRCHLNGLAMQDGLPSYVTCVSQSDVAEGWRDKRQNGGAVIDVQTNEIILSGLSMPHSPRYYQGKLWLLDSGSGYFGYVDRERGQFEPVCFCPGYARGLSFVDHFAIVGLSKPRHNKNFSGLQLDDNLKRQQTDASCGLQVIDLNTGNVVHWLYIEGVVEELYDVVTLPKTRRPMAIGLKTDEIHRVITVMPN